MEKRTAKKAQRWNNELAVERRRIKEKEQKELGVSSGEYIPRQYRESVFNDTDTKARNNERLLLYFFIGVVVCILIWKGFDVIKEQYWMSELETNGQQFLSALKNEDRKIRNEMRQITPSYKPRAANSYQIKTQDTFKGSICKGHVKTEFYVRKTLRCNQANHRCTTINSKNYSKKGTC